VAPSKAKAVFRTLNIGGAEKSAFFPIPNCRSLDIRSGVLV